MAAIGVPQADGHHEAIQLAFRKLERTERSTGFMVANTKKGDAKLYVVHQQKLFPLPWPPES